MQTDHSPLSASQDTQESPIFFTIQFRNVDAGLSDMLIRLSSLYKVGKALSYTYVHTPFICYRSSPLSYRDRILRKFIGNKVYHYMNRFLGFNQLAALIHNKPFSKYKILEIDLESIIQSGVDNLSDLEDKILQAAQVPHSSTPVIFAFLVTENFYKYEIRSKVESLLVNTGIDDTTFRDLATQGYWTARKKSPISIPFQEEKVKLLIHIRRGDRAWIQLDKRVLCLHGKEIAIVDTAKSRVENLESLPQIFQKPVAISEIANLLNTIRSRYGAKNFSTIIISDGYEKAFAEIWEAITIGKITLSPDEVQQLNFIQEEYEQELSTLSNDPSISLILGESKRNFFQSFHAIASADVVIKTSGGFASVIHRFFKPVHQPLVVFDTAQLSDSQSLELFLGQVGAVVTTRKLAGQAIVSTDR